MGPFHLAQGVLKLPSARGLGRMRLFTISPDYIGEGNHSLVRYLLLVLLLFIIGGALTLTIWSPPPPSQPVERIISNDQLLAQ